MMIFSPQCKSGKNGEPTQQGWYLRPPQCPHSPPPLPLPPAVLQVPCSLLEACSCCEATSSGPAPCCSRRQSSTSMS